MLKSGFNQVAFFIPIFNVSLCIKKKQIMPYKSIYATILKTSFLLLLLSAFYGFLMRWNFSFPIAGFSYKNILQSHSHVAFLGWGYLSVLVLLIRFFVNEKLRGSIIYTYTLLVMLICVALMLFSFPLGGYKVFSIVLLAVFGCTSYVISFKLLRDIKQNSYSIKLIKFGIYYYILSSLATWFLAGVLVTQGKTDLYYNTVYFYLHFLYNGFFVFTLFGLFFRLLMRKGIAISEKDQKYFFILLNLACIPSYSLSVLWSDVSEYFNYIGGISALFQLISAVYLIKIIIKYLSEYSISKISKVLLLFLITSYCIKIVIQFFSAFPYFVTKSIALKPFFIIGYLHLFTLGFMTVFIVFLLNEFKIIQLKSRISEISVFFVLAGIFITELLMFSQGFLLLLGKGMINDYSFNLLIASALLLIGIVLMMSVQLFKKQTI